MKTSTSLIALFAVFFSFQARALPGGELTSLDSSTSRAQESISSDEAWMQRAQACWDSAKLDYKRAVIYEDMDKKPRLSISKYIFGRDHSPACNVEINLPVKTSVEACKGINTLGFVFGGRSSFATGEISGYEGQPLASLFTSYKGTAIGAALVGGYGRWQAVSQRHIKIADAIPALPVPIPGGNFALGVTDCQLHYELSPASTEVELTLSESSSFNGARDVHRKILRLDQLLNLMM